MMINRIISKLHKESGQALYLVVIMLGLGGLMITPLLNYTNASLTVNETHRQLTNELYAAEAGAKDAIHYLVEGTGAIPEVGDDPWGPYTITSVNNMAVDVTVDRVAEIVFKINSVAAGTTVETYIESGGSFLYVFDKAIISNDDVELGPNSHVEGDVLYVDEIKPSDPDKLNDQIDGTHVQDEDGLEWWPTDEEIEEMSDWYEGQVEGAPAVPDGYIMQLSGTEDDHDLIGPLYGEGDLQIKGTGFADITGTVFVEGNLDISPTPSCTIYLNGQTIFVRGDITVLPDTAILGSGCIIAIGNIDFQPSMTGDDYILLWSLKGEVWLHPGDVFTGSVVGATMVDLQPNTVINYPEEGPPDGFNFPGYDDDPGYGFGYDLTIETWEIK
ncbi:hypothetical protein ACFLTV_01685 [Chloroflexota bacterium]